ncbi:tetratricopeptide repeat protein [Phormidesmis sp. 146-12]
MLFKVKSVGLAVVLLVSVGMMPNRMLDALGGQAIAQEKTSESLPIGPLCNLPPQFTLVGHLSPVTAMVVSADSKTLVSGDRGGIVNVWSLETGQLLHRLAAYPGAVKAIAITPDGKSIVSVNPLEQYQKDDIAIKVWNLQTGELIQSLTKTQGTTQTLNSLDDQTLIRISETGEDYSYEVKIEFLNRSNGSTVQSGALMTSSGQRENGTLLSTQDTKQEKSATVSVSEDGWIDLSFSFTSLQELKPKKKLCILATPGVIQNIIFSSDSQKLIIATQRIKVLALNQTPIKNNQSEQTTKIQHLERLGLDKLKRKQYYSARQHFWQAFELSLQSTDEQNQVDALYNIAEAYYMECQVGFNRCRVNPQQLYKLVLPYLRRKGDLTRSTIAFNRINLQEKEDRRGEVRESYQEALKKYRLLDNRRAEADTLTKIALVDRASDQESLLKQALKLYRKVGERKGEIEVLQALGLFYSRMVQDKDNRRIGLRTSEAIIHLQAAVKLSRELDDRFLESSILLDLGDAYRWGRQYSQALASYQSSLNIRRSLGDDTGEDILLYRTAQTLRNLGQYQLALENYQKALSVCSLREDKCLGSGREYHLSGMGVSISQEIGEVYFTLKQYYKALDYFQQKGGYGLWGWEDYKNLGITYENLGNIDLALKYFGKILDSRGPGCGDGDVADATIVEAVRQDIAMGNDGGECQGYRETWIPSLSIATFHTAEIYRRRGEYSRAIEMYKNSLAKFGKRAAILNNLGTLYKAQGDYDKALKIYREALWLRRGGGNYSVDKDPYGEAVSLNNIGEIYRRQGQYSKSLETYQQSLKIFRNLASSLTAAQATITPFQDIDTVRKGEASVMHNFGSVYYDLGQYEKALDFYNQSLTTSKSLDDKASQGRSLSNIGLVYEAQKYYSKALEVYQQALIARRDAEDRPGEAATLNNIGLVHIKMNQSHLGIEPLQQALTIFQKLEDKASEANTLDSLGTLYTTVGQYSQALTSYQNALRLIKEANLPPLEGVILSHLGNMLVQDSQPALAIVFYKQSVNIRQTIRQDLRILPRELQESYTETVAVTYRNLADLLIEQGRIGEAQQVLELLKVQELNDYTRTTRTDNTSQSIALDRSEEAITKAHTTLIAFAQDIQNCSDDLPCANSDRLPKLIEQRKQQNIAFANLVKTLEAQLKERSEKDVAFINPNDPNNDFRRRAEEILNSQPGTLLIYPLVLEDKMWLLVGSAGPVFTRYEVKVSQKELAETILQFRTEMKRCETSTCTKADTDRVKQISQKLYQWMFPEKLQKELQANIKQPIQNLVFAPDRATRYIPMGALFDGKQYLIERYTVSTIVAASKTDAGAKLPAQPKVLAMGLSDAVPGFNALPGVPSELDAIVKTTNPKDPHGIFPGDEFLNQTFTRSKLQIRLQQHQILHLATHGKFVPGAIENSFLVLGDGNPFKIPDIQELDGLPGVHLVVLSACETALGDRREQDGIEIAGISNAFLQRGAKSVIASLWQVNDPSTSLWMQRFYQNLANGNLTKSKAMQQVQLDFLKGKVTLKELQNFRASGGRYVEGGGQLDLTHPYYWAPFILIGNGL